MQRQSKITKSLDKLERDRTARECRQKFQGSDPDTLYRIAPDAGLEGNILMLINRAHLALQRGYLEPAERLIDRALDMVDQLGYRPGCAKCWYWKGLVADKRGSAQEAAEAFLNALECVGKYIEGDYLPKHIQVYEQVIQDTVHVEDKAGRIKMVTKLERAARGVEPLHLPSPKPAQDKGLGLDLKSPQLLAPSVTEISGTGERVLDAGKDSLPSSEETVRPELRGLSINIPLPSPSDVSQFRRRRTTSTPVSPHLTSHLKTLPAPRSCLPQNTSDVSREDVGNDPERDGSIAHRVPQYTTHSILDARAKKDQDCNRNISNRPRSSITNMETSVLATRLSKQPLSSVCEVPQGSSATPGICAETFHPAIQDILLSPVNEDTDWLSYSGAEPSRAASSQNSPPQSRPISSHGLPTHSRPTSSNSSPTLSRPTSSHKSLTLQSRPQSRVLGVVRDIEWHEVVQRQTEERASKIQEKKEKYPHAPMKAIRKSVQSLELYDLRSRFGDDMPNPHVDYWGSARSKTPSPKEGQYNAVREGSNDRMSRIYDQRDSAVRRRVEWGKKAEEEEARRARRDASWDVDDTWSQDEERLRQEGWFDRPAPSTEEGDREKRKEQRLTLGRTSPQDMLKALRQIHTPGEEERAKKRETLFLPLTEAQPAVKQSPVTMQVPLPGPGQLQQSVSVDAAMPLRSRVGSIDARGSEPPSPSPLRRSSVPGDGDEGDEEVDGFGEKAQRRQPETSEIRQWQVSANTASPTSPTSKGDTEQEQKESRRRGGISKPLG